MLNVALSPQSLQDAIEAEDVIDLRDLAARGNGNEIMWLLVPVRAGNGGSSAKRIASDIPIRIAFSAKSSFSTALDE